MRSSIKPLKQSEEKLNTSKLYALFFIKAYQVFWSSFFGGSCRFYPTCSEYAVEAFERHSLFRAFKLVLVRVMKCHPFGSKGFDPVPLNQQHKTCCSQRRL